MTDSTTLFSEGTTSDQTMAETHQYDPNVDYVAMLVGEGKKFTDPNALAYGKLAADAHIARIESERRAQAEALSKHGDTEALVNQIVARLTPVNAPNPSQVTNPNGTDNKGPVNTVDPKAIAQMVDDRVNRNLELAQGTKNISDVKAELQKALGPNYASHVGARIRELGLDPKEVDNLAARNPKAALALLNPGRTQEQVNMSGITPTLSTTGAPSRSNPTGTVKNSAYYEKMRKENPIRYASTEVQNERIAMFQALGDKFYS